MQTNIIGQSILSTRFYWVPATGEFIAEISELQHHGLNPFWRLYNDAIDQGFAMVSTRTGKIVEFALFNTCRDADNDVKCWEFKPTLRAAFHNPKLQGIRVIILND